MEQSKLVLSSTKQLIKKESLKKDDINFSLCFLRFDIFEMYMELGKDDCIISMFNLLSTSKLIINDEILVLRDKETDSDITLFNLNLEDEGTKGFFEAYKENNFIKVSISLTAQSDIIENFYGLWFKDKWKMFEINKQNNNSLTINKEQT